MKYTVAFEIHPTGPFGLPDGAKTVVPMEPGGVQMTGDSIHTRTMTRVGYGTLSHYRAEKDAINEKLQFGNTSVEGILRDNFLFLDAEAESPGDAYAIVHRIATRFVQHLSLNGPALFSLKPLYIEDKHRNVYPVPRQVSLGTFTTYSLDELRVRIRATQRFVPLEDPILEKALQYYEHGIFLFERRGEIADFPSTHFRFILAAAFLNLWKAVSTVIGDPSADSDYQSRYRQLGFDEEFFKSEIEAVRRLRNAYDVAHYHLDTAGLDEIEKNFGKAREVAQRVLIAFRDYLADGKPFLIRTGSRSEKAE